MNWISIDDEKPTILSKVIVAYAPYGNPSFEKCFAFCIVNEFGEFFSTEAEEFIEFALSWAYIDEPPL